MKNNSPWLTSIKRTEYFPAIDNSFSTDIAIIGAGISGVLTAFYLLKETDKHICLIEGRKIAHGASGHNAGNLTSMLEVSVPDLIEKYGEEKVKNSLVSLEDSWNILASVMETTSIVEQYAQFIGYGGYSNKENLRIELENIYFYKKWGIWNGKVLVSLDVSIEDFKDELKALCTYVPQEEINRVLDAKKSTDFFAAIPEKMAVANSAFFSESLVMWCLKNYPDRFTVYENSPISRVHHTNNKTIISVDEYKITAEYTILCTNGFENLALTTDHIDIDTKFHHNVRGIIGYMSGYVSENIYEPQASWFYEKDTIMTNHPETDDPYFYITKRPFDIANHRKGLMVVGGPEIPLDERIKYSQEKEIDGEIIKEMDVFVDRTFKESALLDRAFVWHGLMGYTKTGLRIVGKEPCAEHIFYNLGCNGVGIMPAFWSAKRIADIIVGNSIEPTIFDPEDFMCKLK